MALESLEKVAHELREQKKAHKKTLKKLKASQARVVELTQRLRTAEHERHELEQQQEKAALDDATGGDDESLKYVDGAYGPGDKAQWTMMCRIYGRIRDSTSITQFRWMPPACVGKSGTLEEFLCVPYTFLCYHKILAVDMPQCPMPGCKNKLTCKGPATKGPRIVYGVGGPELIVSFRYVCVTNQQRTGENGKKMYQQVPVHTWTSYDQPLVEAFGPMAYGLADVTEHQQILVTWPLIALLHAAATSTDLSLREVCSLMQVVYSTQFLQRLHRFLAFADRKNNPPRGTLGFGKKLDLPPNTALPPAYTFFGEGFCRALVLLEARRLEKRLDSAMVQRRASILSADHVFSALKHTLIGGHRSFKCCYTVLNEAQYVVACVWTMDETMEALRALYEALVQFYFAMAWPLPSVIYVDKCCGRGSFSAAIGAMLKFGQKQLFALDARIDAACGSADLAEKMKSDVRRKPQVLVDLYHLETRPQKVMPKACLISRGFLQEFRAAHWLLQPGAQGPYFDVPQSQRCIPPPEQLRAQLTACVSKWSCRSDNLDEAIRKFLPLYLEHVDNGCVSDPPGVPLIQPATGRTARGSVKNENFHRRLKNVCDKQCTVGALLTAACHRSAIFAHNDHVAVSHGHYSYGVFDLPLLDAIHQAFAAAWPKHLNPFSNLSSSPGSIAEGTLAATQLNNYVHERLEVPPQIERLEQLQRELGLPLRPWSLRDSPTLLPRCRAAQLPLGFHAVDSSSILHAVVAAIEAVTKPAESGPVPPQELLDTLMGLVDRPWSPSARTYLTACTTGQGAQFVTEDLVTMLLAVSAHTGSAVVLLAPNASSTPSALFQPATLDSGQPFFFILDAATLSFVTQPEVPLAAQVHGVDSSSDSDESPVKSRPSLQLSTAGSENLRQTSQRFSQAPKSATDDLISRGHVVLTATSKGRAERDPRQRYTPDENLLLIELTKGIEGKRIDWAAVQTRWAEARKKNPSIRVFTTAQLASRLVNLNKEKEVSRLKTETPKSKTGGTAPVVPDSAGDVSAVAAVAAEDPQANAVAALPPAAAAAAALDALPAAAATLDALPAAAAAVEAAGATDPPARLQVAHVATDEADYDDHDARFIEGLRLAAARRRAGGGSGATAPESGGAPSVPQPARKKPRKEKPAEEVRHPIYSGTTVFFGFVKTRVSSPPRKNQDGKYIYHLEDIEGADGVPKDVPEGEVFLQAISGGKTITSKEAKKISDANRAKRAAEKKTN